VLLVEDSASVRFRMREVLAADGAFEIVGEARTGAEAVDLCRNTRPDVITMDMVLPVLDGLEATRQVMEQWPTPILIVSSSTNRAQLFNTYDALAAGAVDILEKPRGDDSDPAWEQRLRARVKLVARIPVVTHRRSSPAAGRGPDGAERPGGVAGPGAVAPSDPTAARLPSTPTSTVPDQRPYQLVAIGASTGGPGAVVDVLRELPAGLELPVLLVQHISAPFAFAFSDWLGLQLGRRVAYAREGDSVTGTLGQVTVAPPDLHLTVHDGRLRLDHGPERHSCRPSVDVLLESVADEYGARAVGCLLSGMGRDGAQGLLRLRRRGGLTFAQDEATSAVYGMPREAALLGAADYILPATEIGRRLATQVLPAASPATARTR